MLVVAAIGLALVGCGAPEVVAFTEALSASPQSRTATAEALGPPVEGGTRETQPDATEVPVRATATAVATATATSVRPPLSGAPQLGGPPDGETIKRGALLTWKADRPLAEDEYYVLIVTFAHGQETWHDGAWQKEASWALPNYFGLPHSTDGWYEWKVVVMRQTGLGADGKPVGEAISAESGSRRFLCYGD